jgi:hypothetical protein
MHNGDRKEFLSPCLKRILRGRKRNAFVNSGQVISAPNSLKGGVDLNTVGSLFYLTNIVCHRYSCLPRVGLHFYVISEPTGSDYLSDKTLLPSIKFRVVPQREIRGIVVNWGTTVQGGRLRVRSPMGLLWFFISLIIPASLWPWG